MSQLGMNSALWHVYTSAENAEHFTADADSYLEQFDLTAEEHTAVATQDLAALLQLGAHPFLMFKMAFRLAGGFSMEFIENYVGQIRDEQLRDIIT